MKKLLISVIALGFIGSIFAQSTEDPELLIASGDEKIVNQDNLGAIRDFNKAIRISPSNIKALIGRAQAKSSMGSYDEALNDISKALSIDKENAKAYYIRGLIYNGQKKHTDALNDFEKALSIDRLMNDAAAEKALTYYYLQREKEAFENINNLIETQLLPVFYYTRGIMYNFKGKFEKAIEDFNKVVELDSKYNVYNVNLSRGLSYVSVQAYKEAEADLNNAIAIAPNNPSAYVVRGRVFYEQSKYNDAINDYTKAVELSPDNATSYFNLGMAYYKISDIPNACERFHKACSMGNTNACKMVVLSCSDKRK